jgi:hypothetical protein
MQADAAETVALRALGWLVAAPERAGALLAASGLAPGELARRAGDPAFLGFVLDHLLGEEALVRAFCAAEGFAPDLPARARAALPGGDAPHWT